MSAIAAVALFSQLIIGFWAFPQGDIVEIQQCGKRMCGRVAHVGNLPPDARDERNPDHRARRRRICGIQLFRIKESRQSNLWRGSSYSPEDGLNYGVSLRLVDDVIHIEALPFPPVGASPADGPSRPKNFQLRRTDDPGPCVLQK
jgi:uncharacterized protein (DUF2147 family)